MLPLEFGTVEQKFTTPVFFGPVSEWYPLYGVSNIQCQVFLGLPLFHLPSGIQKRGSPDVIFCFLWKTCPIHLHCLLMMMVSILSSLPMASSSWLEIVLGQMICRILLLVLVRVGSVQGHHLSFCLSDLQGYLLLFSPACAGKYVKVASGRQQSQGLPDFIWYLLVGSLKKENITCLTALCQV